MSVRKILVDYTEFMRLRDIEERYEALLKKQQRGLGTSVAADIQKAEEKNELERPLAGKLPSITLPQSAIVLSEKDDEKPQVQHRDKEPWYYLGPPKSK